MQVKPLLRAAMAGLWSVLGFVVFREAMAFRSRVVRLVLGAVLLLAADAFLMEAISRLCRRPVWAGKPSDCGRRSPLFRVLWAPVSSAAYCGRRLKRLRRRVLAKAPTPANTRIAPRLYVGEFPFYPSDLSERNTDYCGEREAMAAAGEQTVVDSILDLTCEMDTSTWVLGRVCGYLCVPVWDGTSPTATQIAEAADWVASQWHLGRAVLIHCNSGRGRATTVAAAALVKLGFAGDVQAAAALISARRPLAKFAPHNLAELERWHCAEKLNFE